ncbi:MAG: transglutaminaseTgpA domain-containing protein, partial [Actinobacteria bacterium]|nr:transglutaminaseTgpA domain-containing protein [Actinomycetota bacterium]
GGGGISYDRFVDLRQRLLSPTNAVVFRATLADGSPPPGQIYWRMESLDDFDGTGWGPASTSIRNYEPGRAIGTPDHRYQGTTTDVLQRILIDELRGEVMPTAGVATEVFAFDGSGAINPLSVDVATDSSLIYKPGLRGGDQYQLLATYPLQNNDLGALATGDNGQLSPIFAGAANAGLFNESPSLNRGNIGEPNNLSFYTELPDDLPAALAGIAALHTRGAVTDFERAWLLQHWFRDSGDFTYSVDVTTGHDALALEEWLSDSASLNYRIGYCQQFATSMAVLGRVLGIPSRVVWGFTPGTVTSDGVITVRDKNAHAWVEMWMEDFGWVRFDPTPRSDSLPESITAGFDPTNFIPDENAAGLGQTPSLSIPEDGNLEGFVELPGLEGTPEGPRWWILVFPVVALLAGVIPLMKAVRRRHRLKTIRSGDITAAWDEIVDRLTDLGETVLPSKTPMEFATETDPALLSLAVNYSAAIYGGRTGTAQDSDLLEVEGWINRRYDGVTRAKAAINPRSLIGRD